MVNYIIPAILTLIVGVILWQIKRERISLEYDIDESDPFPIDDNNGKYFIFSLRNNGNRAIENIDLKIDLNEGHIDSVEYSNSQLLNITQQDNSLVKGKIPLLNPNEKIGAVVTIKNAQSNSYPKIEARAVGVTAHKRSADTSVQYISSFLTIVSAGVAISLFFSTWNTFNQSKTHETIESISNLPSITSNIEESKKKLELLEKDAENIRKTHESELDKIKKENEKRRAEYQKLEKEREQGKPEREQIIFSTLNKSDLSYVIPDLISISGEGIPYWKTGLHLVHSYLTDKKNATKYIKALVSLSGNKQIAPSSKGFLLYLAGKIEKEEGNASKAIQYFEQCKKETPLMYEHLMEQDPAYDLKKIEARLLNSKNK